MKRVIMLVAFLISVALLTACAGPTPKPVVIQSGSSK
jgi:hypothetical protein